MFSYIFSRGIKLSYLTHNNPMDTEQWPREVPKGRNPSCVQRSRQSECLVARTVWVARDSLVKLTKPKWKLGLLFCPHATPQVCVTLTHITLHIAHSHCTPVLHFAFYFHFTFLYSLFIYLYRIYCVLWFLCVVLIVFLCFMFTVCTYTPEQIPGRCKPTWQ